jgi:hypothetical protein
MTVTDMEHPRVECQSVSRQSFTLCISTPRLSVRAALRGTSAFPGESIGPMTRPIGLGATSGNSWIFWGAIARGSSSRLKQHRVVRPIDRHRHSLRASPHRLPDLRRDPDVSRSALQTSHAPRRPREEQGSLTHLTLFQPPPVLLKIMRYDRLSAHTKSSRLYFIIIFF